jgi:hypothetical protein
MLFLLRSRHWNSRDGGTTVPNGFATTDNNSQNDKTVNIDGLNVLIDNQANQYWIDVSPQNSASPGQLCVYGIQVTYSSTVALPVIIK